MSQTHFIFRFDLLNKEPAIKSALPLSVSTADVRKIPLRLSVSRSNAQRSRARIKNRCQSACSCYYRHSRHETLSGAVVLRAFKAGVANKCTWSWLWHTEGSQQNCCLLHRQNSSERFAHHAWMMTGQGGNFQMANCCREHYTRAISVRRVGSEHVRSKDSKGQPSSWLWFQHHSAASSVEFCTKVEFL